VVVHEPAACAGCGSSLTVDGSPAGMIRRQVFIPMITVRAVEHRLVSRRCRCGALTCAAGPAGVSAPVQYGPHAAAIAVHLCLGQHLPGGNR
jgi:transposase